MRPSPTRRRAFPFAPATPPMPWTQDRKAPLIMGVVNVTPDSFSDGGRFHDPEAALDHARGDDHHPDPGVQGLLAQGLREAVHAELGHVVDGGAQVGRHDHDRESNRE